MIWGYQDRFLDKKFEPLSTKEEKSLLTPKSNNASTNRIPLVWAFNKTLWNTKEIVIKHWHLLQINPIHKNTFDENPTRTYRRIANLRELIGSNSILNDRVVHKNNIEKNFIAVHAITKNIISVTSKS